jgi:hypothetical protein
MEQLSCFAYSWILQNASLWEHFRTDAAIANFWKLGDEKRRSLWGRALDITAEPRYSKYHAFLGRAIT